MGAIKSFFSYFVSSAPVETKVASGGLMGLAASIVVQFIQLYGPGVKLPSPALMALVVTFASTVAAYLAPHTRTPSDPPKS